MKMTLGEALKGDVVALNTCILTMLPNDASGRIVLYLEPHRHTRQGYTSDSMMRAIWYVAEKAAQDNTDIAGGIVQLVWCRNASLFDYDMKCIDGWASYLSNCWPIKLLANHICCPTAIDKIMKP